MTFKPIKYNGKILSVHKASINPDFNSRTVLVENPWEYVEMWLKNQKEKDALFYWGQAKNFHKASQKLPNISSPVTAYYSFLNATKALLQVKKRHVVEKHGISGENVGRNGFLSNEKVKFQQSGILSELCAYFGETSHNDEYSLKELLYNLPYIHRAYKLTFKSQQDLFIPIRNPIFVKKDNSSESWFCAEIVDTRYTHHSTIGKISGKYERDVGIGDKFLIRRKKRFKWDDNNIMNFKAYHQKIRNDIFYIYGSDRLWYLKKSDANNIINRSSLTITFAIMHRLSELARYSPMLLNTHFESKHNWLLSEFINTSLIQFIDEISAEITGQEFMLSGIR